MATVATIARSFKYAAHNNSRREIFEPFVKVLIQFVKSEDLAVKKGSLESLCEICYNKDLYPLLAPFA